MSKPSPFIKTKSLTAYFAGLIALLAVFATPLSYSDTTTAQPHSASEQVLIADPALAVLGPASVSHRQEIAEITSTLEGWGVEIRQRQGTLSYAPGLSVGQPGQMIVDPSASYSAWLHEFQHATDDHAIGWGGMRTLMDSELRWKWEQNAYAKEIELMTRLGYPEVVKQLKINMANERRAIFGETE